MTRFRIAAALAATAIATATVALPAHAAQSGVGTASSSTTVLDVELFGDVLGLDILTDSSVSTIDGNRAASTTLIPAAVRSSLNDALNFTAPSIEASSTGGRQNADNTVMELPAEIAAAATGKVNVADLVAIVDSNGARSALESGLVDASVGGVIATIDSISSGSSTGARSAQTTSARSFAADSITILDLGTLLKGLGIDLADLPTATLLEVMDALGVTVPGVGGDFKVNKLIGEINAAIDDLQAVVNDEIPDLTTDVTDILGELGITEPNADVKSQVNDTIDELQATLADVLNGVLAVLDGATLVGLEGAEASVSAKANAALDSSTAETTAAIGAIRVGNFEIPSVDALATTEEVKASAQAAVDQINTVLGAVHPALGSLPDLPSLVELTLFASDTSVSQSGDYVESLASLALVTVDITAPADLAAIIDGLDPVQSAGAEIAELGGTPVSVGAAADALAQLTGVDALANGARVRVGVLSAGADFALQAVGDNPERAPLAATGGETNLIMIIAAGLGAAALLIRRRLAELAG